MKMNRDQGSKSMRSLMVAGLLAVTALLTSCGDPIPQDYTPQVVVEAFLYVDQPIKGIRIYWSQSLSDTFKYERAAIRTGMVEITTGSTRIPLHFVTDSNGGAWEAVDTAIHIQPTTTYNLAVNVEGRSMSGVTTTPVRIEWIKPPKDTIQYPGFMNEGKPVDSLKVSWTVPPTSTEYMVAMECLDTLRYGVYLIPPTTDSNRRIRDSEFDDDTPLARERTRIAFAQAPNIFSWGAFKWFGRHEFRVYAGDRNFINWLKQLTFGGRQINPNLGSIKDGIGVFGSASVVKAPTFLRKDVTP